MRRMALLFSACAILISLACGGSNVVGPGNQPQVKNLPGDFSFQVSSLNNVTQTFSYNWTNTGDSANVNQSSSVTAGSATLTIREPLGTVVYTSGLQNNGTFHTLKATTGTWKIDVVMTNVSGALNFRVQKAP